MSLRITRQHRDTWVDVGVHLRLSDERPTDAARVAVLAAKKHYTEESFEQAQRAGVRERLCFTLFHQELEVLNGEKFESSSRFENGTKAYIQAYRWDLQNEDAREQMIEICAETSVRYSELRREYGYLRAEVERLKSTSLTWSLEGSDFHKFGSSSSGLGVRSPQFMFNHFEGWMELFPRGVGQAKGRSPSKGSFQMFLKPTELLLSRLQGRQAHSTSMTVRTQVRVGSVEYSSKIRIVGNQDRGLNRVNSVLSIFASRAFMIYDYSWTIYFISYKFLK